MGIDFDSNKPIYQQIMDRIAAEIVRGERTTGDKLPSVREYALDCGVNPNTIQRVYRELEQLGVVESRRGQGTFVTEKQERLSVLREDMKKQYVESFFLDMMELGFTLDEMIAGLRLLEGKKGEK